MKQLLEQFKNLNPKDPGGWPPLPKAMLLVALLIVIVALGYVVDWQEQMDTLDTGRLQEAKLKDEYGAPPPVAKQPVEKAPAEKKPGAPSDDGSPAP